MEKDLKDILLKDLCARLPYGVKCSFGVDDAVYEITGINPTCCGASEIQATHVNSSVNGDFRLNSCKPYLFPLSSMTEEQQLEIDIITDECISIDKYSLWDLTGYGELSLSKTLELFNWLNINHFDYRRLNEKGLAIDATGKNIY